MSNINVNGVSAELKYAKIDYSASGSQALVAAVAGKRIRVISLFLIGAGAVTTKFQSAATDLTGAMSNAANGGFVLPENKSGWFQTNVGEALNLNLGGAVNVAGGLTYIEI